MKHLFSISEMKQSLLRVDVSFIFAWYDIKLRYRRTKLGLLWLSITLIIESSVLSLLFSNLFKENFFNYYPYVFIGRIIWQLLAGVLRESVNAIIASKEYILNHNLPSLVFIMRVCIRNLLIFSHNSLFALLLVGIGGNFSFFSLLYWLLLPVGALFVTFAIAPYALILGILGARFRDLSLIMPYCMQILFYTTPVVWKTNYLSSKYAALIHLNPLVSLVEFLRALFLGHAVPMATINTIFILMIIGWTVAIFTYNLSKNRLFYWVI